MEAAATVCRMHSRVLAAGNAESCSSAALPALQLAVSVLHVLHECLLHRQSVGKLAMCDTY
jgi:hypothetical protein